MIHHLLIGIPGSGKSTLAAQWVERDRNCRIVSTDQIREQLFGNADAQKDWAKVEAEAITQVKQAIAAGQSVIYDATNAKRAWRMDLLQKLAAVGATEWIGWQLDVPLEECVRRDQQRERQVGTEIVRMYEGMLQRFKPIAAEGFLAVYKVPVTGGTFNFQEMDRLQAQVARSILNRSNKNAENELHQYSALIDFERLMYLLALLIRHPGAGDFHVHNPQMLETLVKKPIAVGDPVQEIAALMEALYGSVYADCEKLSADLEWLEQNGFFNQHNRETKISLEDYAGDRSQLEQHTYSDRDRFLRLVTAIRLLVHEPYYALEDEGSVLDSFHQYLQQSTYISKNELRKDIEYVLNPYQILAPVSSRRRGYFVGATVLTTDELLNAFRVMRSQVESLEDPIALQHYQTVEQKLYLSRLLSPETAKSDYPIRAIANQVIVDLKELPASTLYRKLDLLSEAIVRGDLLEVGRVPETGKPENYPHEASSFHIYPLQILFHNIGWYLGYECAEGEAPHLLRFERLDRLIWRRSLGKSRGSKAQWQALKCLQRLREVSYSLHLGNDARLQEQYLSSDRKIRRKAEVTLELWCSNYAFRYISEGTKRFPPRLMKMSKRPNSYLSTDPATGDQQHPHWLRVTLPVWVLEDWELRRWIVGFGKDIKVKSPEAMVKGVRSLAKEIFDLYNNE